MMVTKYKRDVSYRQTLDIWIHEDPWIYDSGYSPGDPVSMHR